LFTLTGLVNEDGAKFDRIELTNSLQKLAQVISAAIEQ